MRVTGPERAGGILRPKHTWEGSTAMAWKRAMVVGAAVLVSGGLLSTSAAEADHSCDEDNAFTRNERGIAASYSTQGLIDREGAFFTP